MLESLVLLGLCATISLFNRFQPGSFAPKPFLTLIEEEEEKGRKKTLLRYPKRMKLERGKKYYYCTCGYSKVTNISRGQPSQPITI
jgi:hypothetical protein